MAGCQRVFSGKLDMVSGTCGLSATDIAAYGYTPGTCPVAEEVGRGIVTIPLDVPSSYADRFMQHVENLCRELQPLVRA